MINPTIVIAPGAWPLEEFFHPLIQAFQERSYSAVCEVPPSYPKTSPQTEVLVNPDIFYLREKVLTPSLDEGRDVVLLMHSYGGIYGGAAVEGLSKKERSASQKPGGVIALVFVAAFTALKGTTAMQAMGIDPNHLPDWIDHDKSTGLVRLSKVREMLFHDLPNDEAIRLANALPSQPYESFAAPVNYDPYGDPMFRKRFGYVFTEADRILPLEAQKMYAETAGAETVMMRDASHSAHIERPGELADATIDLVKTFEKNLK